MAYARPYPRKPQSPGTFLSSGVGGVPESITFQRSKLRQAHLLKHFPFWSFHEELCSQKNILPSDQPPSDQPQGLCSPSPGRFLDPSRTSSHPANAAPPSQSPLRSFLDPWGSLWGWHFLISPSASPLPPRQSPRHKDPLTSSRPSAQRAGNASLISLLQGIYFLD